MSKSRIPPGRPPLGSRLLVVAGIAMLAFAAFAAAGWTGSIGLEGTAGVPGALHGIGLVPAAGTGVAGTLLAPKYVATPPSSFYSIDAQTDCASCIATSAATDSFLNNTPFHWVRYGENDDQCNETSDTLWSSSGTSSHGCAFNVASLKQWCDSRTPHCRSVMTLPGENNNSKEDTNIAHYLVHTLGFQPTYFAIGNEPTGWTHYGIPWSHWRTTDHQKPTPLAYAVDVRNAIAAVKKVDPAARFIGVEAACSCNTAWFQDTVRLNGPNLAAIAVHNYPSATGHTSVDLAQFFAALTASGNVTGSVHAVRSAISGLCAKCTTLPIFVNEYNAGPGWSPSNYGGTYANAVFLAASVAQALTANVTQLTIFNLQTYSTKGYGYSMLNGNAVPGPTGVLFSKFLPHLALGQVFRAPVRTSLSNVWSVVTENSTDESLLVVNANTAHPLDLRVLTSFPLGLLGSVLTWAPGQRAPTSHAATLLGHYTVPSEGMLLLTVHPLVRILAPSSAGSNGSAARSVLPAGLDSAADPLPLGEGAVGMPYLLGVAEAPRAGRGRDLGARS